jgi:hypothetical protein
VEGGSDRVDVVGRTEHEDRFGAGAAAVEQCEHVVGGRLDALRGHPVPVDQGNVCFVRFDDAHRNVAIITPIGNARSQRIGRLLL